jgi:flavodoxin
VNADAADTVDITVKYSNLFLEQARYIIENLPDPPKTKKEIEEWAEKLANDVKNADD